MSETTWRDHLSAHNGATCEFCKAIKPEAELKHRLVRAREVFQNAREQILTEYAHGEIGEYRRNWFLQMVDDIEPLATDPDELTEEHVAVVEAAIIVLRDQAISLKRSGEICRGGLNRFLHACGLRVWEPFDMLADHAPEGTILWAPEGQELAPGDES